VILEKINRFSSISLYEGGGRGGSEGRYWRKFIGFLQYEPPPPLSYIDYFFSSISSHPHLEK
jgi:hypothetical protein